MTTDYLPQVGESIAARRLKESRIYNNTVVGPVIERWENAVRVRCNAGTDIETDFQLFFSDWSFQLLF
jgi:hypothetical protein